MTDAPWTYDSVRAELDAMCAARGIGTFRSRYTLTASELFVLVSRYMTTPERVVCTTVLGAELRRKMDDRPAFLRETRTDLRSDR